MSHKTKRRRRWGLLPLALALAFMVIAVPAAAKGPILYGSCPPAAGKAPAPPHVRALCERREAASDHQGFNRADPDILTGGVAVMVLMIAVGLLVATQRRDAHGSPRTS